MWVRKRIEISNRDLVGAFWYCLAPGDRDATVAEITSRWSGGQAVVCLSVRSGFDLLLHSVAWPPGSEIIMSGLTIPDMQRIVEENGLVPVGVDVDLDTISPNLDEIRRQITPRTRAIVVAHLLGGLCDMDPIIELARQHGLMVIEDGAQAWSGRTYQGDPRADVSMFSFGPIKTNTALGGGVLLVRNEELRQTMLRQHDQWRIQGRGSAARRFARFALVRMLSTRPCCGGIYRVMKMFGTNHDQLASGMARGFAGPDFFRRIRRQPSLPLLRLLNHKLTTYNSASTAARAEHGQFLVNALGPDVEVLGAAMKRQTWWVFPLLVEEPHELVQRLWDAGFDATNSCSLVAIFSRDDSVARFILGHIVFLPLHADMPKKELTRMARIVRQSGARKPEFVVAARNAPSSGGTGTATGKESPYSVNGVGSNGAHSQPGTTAPPVIPPTSGTPVPRQGAQTV